MDIVSEILIIEKLLTRGKEFYFFGGARECGSARVNGQENEEKKNA